MRGDGVLPARADVAVIGGGLTGLSAALTLSRGGLDVVVIDGAALGAGASTRNAGFLSAELRRPLAALIERFGRARALAIAREARRAAAFLKALIDEGRLALDGLLTHREPYARAAAAYRTAFNEPACLKMVLDWSGSL